MKSLGLCQRTAKTKENIEDFLFLFLKRQYFSKNDFIYRPLSQTDTCTLPLCLSSCVDKVVMQLTKTMQSVCGVSLAHPVACVYCSIMYVQHRGELKISVKH